MMPFLSSWLIDNRSIHFKLKGTLSLTHFLETEGLEQLLGFDTDFSFFLYLKNSWSGEGMVLSVVKFVVQANALRGKWLVNL